MTAGRTRILVEAALVVALSAALHFVRAGQLPFGGTLSMEMLPIVVFSLRRGLVPGVAAGAVFGVVDLFIEPIGIVHWAQFLLDYPVAFGVVGLSGVLRALWEKHAAAGRGIAAGWYVVLPATVIGAAARFGVHWVSGVIFWTAYAPKGTPAWLYSIAYNATYMVPSAIACGVAAAVIMPVLQQTSPPK